MEVCIENNREYKCVLFNGKAHYVAKISSTKSPGSKHYSIYPHTEILKFANSRVKETCVLQNPTMILKLLEQSMIINQSLHIFTINIAFYIHRFLKQL